MGSGESRSVRERLPPRPSPARNARRGRGTRRLAAAAGSSFALLAVKHGEPNRWLVRIGPIDPMAAMRRDLDPIAGAKMPWLGLIREAQSRRAGQQHDPFRLILVVPETGRARLAERDNALDAQAWGGCERFGNFCGSGIGQIAQQVHGPAIASTPATARRQPS